MHDNIVMLPGWGFKASVMQPFAAQFPNHKIYYADLPIITNELPFAKLVEKLNLTLPNNSELVGWSLGGLFAIALCDAYPEKYKKLTLLASTPKFAACENWNGITESQKNTFVLEAERNLPHLIKHFHRLVAFPHLNILTHLQKHTLDHEPSLKFYLKLLFELDLRKELNNLKIPITQIIGEQDAIVKNNGDNIILSKQGHWIASAFSAPRDDVAIAFNKAADTYDQHATLQHTVGKKLISLIPSNNFKNIADFGCGTGTTSKVLAETIAFDNLYLIDNAEKLLSIAEATTSSLRMQGSIHTIPTNFDNLSVFNNKINLAFSNMALHWSKDLEATLKKIHNQLRKGGLLVFSIPLVGTFKELKNIAACNEQVSPDNILSILNATDYKIVTYLNEIHIEDFETTLEALRSIKKVGATHVKNKKKDLLTKSVLKHPMQLTYHIGYFIAERQ